MGFFLIVFVAVGVLCEQELVYWRTESGRGGLFMILEVSCTYEVNYSSQESLTGEFVSENGKFCD